MDEHKRYKLKENGWVEISIAEFLGLTPEEITKIWDKLTDEILEERRELWEKMNGL